MSYPELWSHRPLPADEHEHHGAIGGFVASSPALVRTVAQLEMAARHTRPILLQGSTGAGKTTAARAIHDASPRSEAPFIVVNCGAIPAELFEGELFGWEKGAHSTANQVKRGLIESAHGGTLFLDELGELPAIQQAKLLTVLDSGEVRRVGGVEVLRPDFRLICATNRDLGDEMASGRFRSDLFFRISIHEIALPPASVASRVGVLHQALVVASGGSRRVGLMPCAVQLLSQHDWPGGMRVMVETVKMVVELNPDTDRLTADLFAGLLREQPTVSGSTGRTASNVQLPPMVTEPAPSRVVEPSAPATGRAFVERQGPPEASTTRSPQTPRLSDDLEWWSNRGEERENPRWYSIGRFISVNLRRAQHARDQPGEDRSTLERMVEAYRMGCRKLEEVALILDQARTTLQSCLSRLNLGTRQVMRLAGALPA